MITSTRHAIERYNERVHPGLTHREAMFKLNDELEKAVMTTEEPWPGCTRRETTLWAVVDDGRVALPINQDRYGRKFAVTCVVQGEREGP